MGGESVPPCSNHGGAENLGLPQRWHTWLQQIRERAVFLGVSYKIEVLIVYFTACLLFFYFFFVWEAVQSREGGRVWIQLLGHIQTLASAHAAPILVARGTWICTCYITSTDPSSP